MKSVISTVKCRDDDELFKTLSQELPVGVCIMQDGKFCHVNNAFPIAIGYTVDELVGKDSLEIVVPENREMVKENTMKMLKGELRSPYQFRVTGKDGSIIWVMGTVKSIQYHGRRAVLGNYMEITERKLMEEAAKESEERYKELASSITDVFFAMDEHLRYTYWNKASEILTGVRMEDAIEKSIQEVFPDRPWRRKAEEMYRKVLQTQQPQTFVNDYDIDGRHYILEISAYPSRGGMSVFVKDITEHKQAEEALRESEERYRALFDHSLDCVYVHDFEGNFLDANEAALKLFGYEKKDIPHLNFASLLSEDQLPKAIATLQELKDTGAQKQLNEFRVRRKDGSFVDVEVISAVIYGNGKPHAIQGVGRDVTERRKVEEALQKSEERYRTLAENAGEAIFVVQDDVVKFINPKGVELSGYSGEELASRPFAKSIYPDDISMVADRYLKRLRGELVPQTYDFRIIRKDGDIRWGELNAVPISWEDRPAVLCFMSDITERKQAGEALRHSEERYRTILEEMEDAYFEVDLGGHFTFANNSVCRDLGYSREELIRMSYNAFTAEDDIESVFRVFNQVYRTGVPNKGFPWKTTRKDGSHGFAETSISLLRNEQGETIGFRGVGRDITERKKMEEALRQSEEKYRTILDETGDGYFETDLAGNLTFVNDAMIRLLGYSREEMIGMNFKAFTPEEKVRTVFEAYNRMYRTGEPLCDFPTEVIRKGGGHRFAETSAFPIRNDRGEIVGFRGVRRDITARKQMEEALRHSEEKYRTILEEMEDSYFEVDLGGHLTFVNNSVCRDLGYSREELMGKSYKAFTVEEDIESVFRVFNEVYRTGVPNKGFPWKTVRKDGTHGFAETSISLLRNDNGETIGFRGVGRDISDRKRAEERLRQSEENYRTLFNSSVISTVILDAETMKVAMVNQAAVKMFGFSSVEEAPGANPFDFILPEDRRRFFDLAEKSLVEQESRQTNDLRAVTKDGREIWISVTGARIMHKGKVAGLISFMDITEQKKQNERLMMTDRLASLGELASGTAHELNNPLTSIIGFSQLLMEREVPDDIREDLKLIHNEAQRAAGVTKNLLTFARKHAPVKQLTQINNAIEDVLKLRTYEHKVNGIEVERQLDADLPEIMVDYFQMQQVFMNIIINAEYFMTKPHNKGTLTITTKKQNNTVRISFADDGSGIPPENLKRIFDPFFTTKEAGKGTGLGLSICHGIVTEHGGQIYARSQPGKGATISVELPINGRDLIGGTL